MNIDLHSRSAYEYELPEELIAQLPCCPRDHSRLMIVDRLSGAITEVPFHELQELMQPGDSLVFNDTKVIPARLIGRRPHGGKAEILLTSPHADGTWNALAKPGRKITNGTVIEFGEDFSCEVLESFEDGSRRIQFACAGSFDEALSKYGRMPLPHYIHGGEEGLNDKEWYQTVYAANPGAAAAPTAGLHFTQELLNMLGAKGVSQTRLTLHVGLGTFRPVQTEDIRNHAMHYERFIISPESADALNARKNGARQICVGTTSCRALESAADTKGKIAAGDFETNIFIHPGYNFKYMRTLLTNFHLPGSTLLMLVSAFAGYELIREAYAKAIEKKFRFFSYGDAMLIL
jgi:S-adenosylmethionine:tRNA ribosyltransferase-isomerase